MTKKINLWTISILCCLTLLGLTWPTLAQTPTPPTPREALIQAIQAQAQRDVELGKPSEGIAGLQVLFGADAANAGMTMAEVLDVYETAYQAAIPVKSFWEKLLDALTPNAGWIAAIVLFVLVIFRDVLKDNLTKFATWLWQRAYLRLARFRPFWGLALGKYRKALVARYEQLKIPFRPGRPLEMREVYVPLKVQGTSDTDLIEAYRAVAEHQWLMITGAPGAGKTMLLRRLALHYAEGGLADFPTRPVPVLLELNRLSASQDALETHLAKVLEDNDFPGGKGFIAAGLEHGMPLLLLDGLDEVASDARGRVVRQVKDALQANPQVRAVITCRTQVYNGEFDDLVHQRLEIAPFSDQQIQRFLSSWQPQMPPGKSTENLLRNLRERPHIMGLARNPLLLTIIAYLYTDTPFVLPHSRTAFYDKALAVLLEQWDQVKGTPNRFTVNEKQLVLHHLALFIQDNAAQGGRDRRSVDLPTLLAEIAKALPGVSRKPEEARPLLDEIVARSGLLLALDGGLRYQFAHLTLQEFFAAQKLQDDAAALLTRFRADPDAWRETLKLWCGLPHDSTGLIRALYADNPILAFECVGDTQQMDADFAGEIIAAFKGRLGEDGVAGEAVTRAFATVATNPQRGKEVFDFLVAVVKEPSASPRCMAAAQALALSNLPQAATVLAACAPDIHEVHPLLAQMGDLATPILAEWAGQGHEWAFDALQAIGTPNAAKTLTALLWAESERQPYWAAWRLAKLLTNSNVEDALISYPLNEMQRNAKRVDWIWDPFKQDLSLRIITGRVAHLLYTTNPEFIVSETQELDPRLLLALCTIAAAQDQKIQMLDETTRKQIQKQFAPPMISFDYDTESFISSLFERVGSYKVSQETECYYLRSFDDQNKVLDKEAYEKILDEYPVFEKYLSKNKSWRSSFLRLLVPGQESEPLDKDQSALFYSWARALHRVSSQEILQQCSNNPTGEHGQSEEKSIDIFTLANKLVLIDTVCKNISQDKTWQELFQRLPYSIQFEWIQRLVQGARLPDKDDWHNLYIPSEYQFAHSWHIRGLTALMTLLVILAVLHLQEFIVHSSQLLSWANGFTALLSLCLIISSLWLARQKEWALDSINKIDQSISFFSLFELGLVTGAVAGSLSGNWVGGAVGGIMGGMIGGTVSGIKFWKGARYSIIFAIGGAVSSTISGAMVSALIGVIGGAIGGVVIYVTSGGDPRKMAKYPGLVAISVAVGNIVTYETSLLMYSLWGLLGLSIFWSVWLLAVLVLYRDAKRRQRAAENPLHGLLPGTEPSPTTSLQRGRTALLPRIMALLMRRPRGKRSGGQR
jgi:hypothetical protein